MSNERATGRDVIVAVVENMRQSLEPLVTETIAPSLYQVYLHSEDYDHLRTLFPKLEAEAQKLLESELDKMNRGSVPVFHRLLRKKEPGEPAMRYLSAEGRFYIRFQEDPNGRLQPGDVEVVSEFAELPAEGYGSGSKTRRISTTRRLGQTVNRRVMTDTQTGYARLNYQDKRGAQTYLMTKDEIVIGRESPEVWVDLRLDTLPDVSREHARIQRLPSGKFRIKDLSKLGTTVDRTPVPRSLETVNGEAKDLDRWFDLPDKCRIGLAGVVYLDFEKLA